MPSPEIYDVSVLVSGENCGKENGLILDLVVNGSTELDYRWYNSMGDTVGLEVDLTDVPSGTYRLLVRDTNNCETISAEFTVPEIPGPEIDDATLELIQASCEEPNGAITGLEITGQSGLTYEWTNSSGTVVGDTSQLTGLLPGIYT